MTSREDKISEFCSITGADEELANSLLSVCDDNLEMAINMHMEDTSQQQASSLSKASTSSSSARENNYEEEEDDDQVRAPIPQKRETLIGPGYEGYAIRNHQPGSSHSSNGQRHHQAARVRSVFDGFRNFGNEARNYDPTAPTNQGKKRTLEELFKPPVDITFKGDWQAARDAATDSGKWLLVNVQDACEFQCQVLNRDVWSSEAVKTIIKEHFVFWQQYKESAEAQRYMTFYPINEWPHVNLVDPRTGEQMVTWNKLDANAFCTLVAEFLSVHPPLEMQNRDDPRARKRKSETSLLDADEDDQLAAAIQASLVENHPSTTKDSISTPTDSDLEAFSDEESTNNSSSSPVVVKRTNNSTESITANNTTEKSDKVATTWTDFLGDENDAQSSIMIRFPDGRREAKNIPCSSKLAAIVKYVVNEGFPLEKYEIVTNFPRRILTDMDDSKTLKELELFPQETVFVQQRS